MPFTIIDGSFLEALDESTQRLYSRFPEAKLNLGNVLSGITEESAEAINALQYELLEDYCKEVADVLVVLMNGIRMRGGTVHNLEIAIVKTIDKNNKKTPDTHYWDEERKKITSKAKKR